MHGKVSLRAIGVGSVLGIVFAATAMYAGHKAAIIDGGNIPAAIVAFGILTAVLGRRPTVDDGNIVQTVSSSAAMMSITGGTIGPIAAMSIAGEHVSLGLVVIWGIAVGVLGTLMAVPLRGVFITRGSLPFPSGAATAEVLDNIYRAGQSARSRVRMLAIGGALAFVLAFARMDLGWFPELTVFPVSLGALTADAIGLGIGWSPLLAGIGFLSGARTAISLVIGCVIAWVVIAPRLVAAGIATPDYLSLVNWLLWSGTGLMLGGTVGGALGAWRDLRSSLREVAAAGAFRMTRGHTIGIALAAIAVVGFATVAFGVHPLISVLALVLSAVLCAAAARAMGETDNTPAGPLGGFAQVVVGAVAPGGISAPLSGGGIVNGTLMQSAMMLQNWKTGDRVGTSPRAQLVAQLVGVVVGAIACVLFFELIRRAYGLGTDLMPAPAALSWKATADVVKNGVSAMPAYAPHCAAAAFGIGCVLSYKPLAKYAPSPVAMGMAFILTPYISLTIAIGGLVYWFAARRSQRAADEEGIALAAGLIGGEAIAGLVVAVLLLARG